jgi:hypothetical protein
VEYQQSTGGTKAMNEMNRKKLYIWRLATFLREHGMVMAGEELAAHLNRNNFRTSYGSTFEGGRGTYKLIRETWSWVNDELGLPEEAKSIAEAYVKPDGSYAYEE